MLLGERQMHAAARLEELPAVRLGATGTAADPVEAVAQAQQQGIPAAVASAQCRVSGALALAVGDCIHEVSDLVAKTLAHPLERNVRLLDEIVKQSGGQEPRIGFAEALHVARNADDVVDQTRAVFAHLSHVLRNRPGVGAANRLRISLRKESCCEKRLDGPHGI